MLKVYRLLRNNREMGPYTLEELIQTNLKQHDLIWIEGKSSSWAYPYEIEVLKTYVPAPPPPPKPTAASTTPTEKKQPEIPDTAKHIYVSLPNQPRQEPAPKPVVPSTPGPTREEMPLRPAVQPVGEPDEGLQTAYARSLDEAEEAYTHWIYEKKRQKKSGAGKYLLPVALLAAVVTGGIIGGQAWRNASIKSATMEQPASEPSATPTVQHTPVLLNDMDDNSALPQTDSIAPSTALNTELPAIKKELKDSRQQKPQDTMAAPTQPEETPEQQNTVVQQPQAQPEEQVTTTPQPTTEQKERRGFLGGLFKKKQNEPETANKSEPNNSDDQNTRKVRRRNAEAATAPATNLAAAIELRSTIKNEGWMLGIMGQKLTLHNHSRELVNTATVEVSYFSEENNLLAKKTVSFSNVGPKGQATVALPDHRLAEKATFRLLAVTGADTAANQ